MLVGADAERDQNQDRRWAAAGFGTSTSNRNMRPPGKIMTPEKIAGAAMYWLSDESKPISGSVVELEQYPHDRPQIL